MERIKEQVIQLLLETFDGAGVEKETIADMDLCEDLGMESVQFITLIIQCETLFEIVIPEDFIQMEFFKNVSAITDTIFKIKNQMGGL